MADPKGVHLPREARGDPVSHTDWINRALGDSCNDLDEILPGATERFVGALSPAFSELASVRERFSGDRASAKRCDVGWHLLWDACNALIAAFVLVRRGYQTEPLAVARTVLERVACAVVLYDNPEEIPAFLSGKLDATDTIRPAATVIADLGWMWGMLSKLGAHVTKDNVGTSVIACAAEGPIRMAIGGRFLISEHHRKGVASFVSDLCSMAELLTSAPERIFFDTKRKKAILTVVAGRLAKNRSGDHRRGYG